MAYILTLLTSFHIQVFMERLKCREEDENDKLIPTGSVVILLSNVEDLYKVSFEIINLLLQYFMAWLSCVCSLLSV